MSDRPDLTDEEIARYVKADYQGPYGKEGTCMAREIQRHRKTMDRVRAVLEDARQYPEARVRCSAVATVLEGALGAVAIWVALAWLALRSILRGHGYRGRLVRLNGDVYWLAADAVWRLKNGKRERISEQVERGL